MIHAQIEQQFSGYSFNGKLLLSEMYNRGIAVKGLGDTFIVKATHQGHTELIYDVLTSLSSYPMGIMIDDKFYAKKLLQKYGYAVPTGKVFTADDSAAITNYAATLGYPVVLKPTVGSHGDSVYLNIVNETQLQQCLTAFIKDKTSKDFVLVEQFIEGNEYRLFITKDGFFAVVHREPAHVLGDGKSNISELVKSENYRRMHPRNTCLCEIKVDKLYLKSRGLTLTYQPKNNEKVYVRQNSNVSTGGSCYEVTSRVHPSFKKLAASLLDKLQVPYIGIDILCESIESEVSDYAICELNSAPGLSLHMLPQTGEPQNSAAALVDVLFPETKS